MPTYALLYNDKIYNIIIADNLEIAKEITTNIFPSSNAMQIDIISNGPDIGFIWDGEKFINPEIERNEAETNANL